MPPPQWIHTETVLHIHELQIKEHGGLHGVRDMSLLDSALSRPINHFMHDPNLSIPELGAIYATSLSQNHPFNDGNKRISLVVSFVFCELNGFNMMANQEEAASIFLELASGRLPEDNLKTWFLKSVSKTPQPQI